MSLPDPLVPADCDLQDFPRMMIDIPRLFASSFDAMEDDTAWRCGVTLWLKSFHQIPAGSLEDNDADLVKACGLGRGGLEIWKRIRADALRGFVKCSDGRLYHPMVCEMALEAWIAKLQRRLTGGQGNASRWKTEFDAAPLQAEILAAAEQLRALNPKSAFLARLNTKALGAGSPPDPGGNADGIPPRSRLDRGANPKAIPLRSEEKRRDNITPQTPLPGGDARSDQIDPGGRWFAAALADFPVEGKANGRIDKAEAEWPAAVERSGRDAETLAKTVPVFAKLVADGKVRCPAFHRWLANDGWKTFLPALPPPIWPGPRDIRDEVLTAKGQLWTEQRLDALCGWRDLPHQAVTCGSGAASDTIERGIGSILRKHGLAVVVVQGAAA